MYFLCDNIVVVDRPFVTEFLVTRIDAGDTSYNMEFGSKYVYSYTDSEEESVSEEEFETGMDVTADARYCAIVMNESEGHS